MVASSQLWSGFLREAKRFLDWNGISSICGCVGRIAAQFIYYLPLAPSRTTGNTKCDGNNAELYTRCVAFTKSAAVAL
jgi:hypothetical protein